MKSRLENVTIVWDPPPGDVESCCEGLAEHNREATGGRFDFPRGTDPGLVLRLVVKDRRGAVVGGVETSSVLGVMWLEVLWVAEAYRRHGLASWLVLEAERIAHAKGCVGAGTWTFDWQGAQFYPVIGYQLNGIHDGYPFGIKEHVLTKRLPGIMAEEERERHAARLLGEGFELVDAPTQDELNVVGNGLEAYSRRHAGEEYSHPNLRLHPVLRSASGQVVGGLEAYSVIRVLALEALWIDPAYRGQGLGRRLLTEAENLARERGCLAVNSHCLSFQSPGFFRCLGYGTFGKVDVYIDGHIEDLLIKRL